MNISIDSLDIVTGEALISISQGNDTLWLDATFASVMSYVDDSFDHAFGIEKCGHWDFLLHSLALSVSDMDGKPMPYDTEAIIDAIYDEFNSGYESYVNDYLSNQEYV